MRGLSPAERLDWDPAGVLAEEYGDTWSIHRYAHAGDVRWKVQRWHPITITDEDADRYRIANAWEGSCTVSQLRSWLYQQGRAVERWQGS